jgi:hypothetical protein
MKLLRAKVKGTGAQVVVAKKENETAIYEAADGTVYKADELEIMEELLMGNDPLIKDFDPSRYLKEILEMQKSHFWRDQRVEIVKILLQSVDLSKVTTASVVNNAEDIIQKLKALGD